MITSLYEKVEENGEITFKPYDINKIKICGRTLQEIMDILGGLDIEKEYDLEFTMKNLKKYQEIMQKEHYKQIEEIRKEVKKWKNIT